MKFRHLSYDVTIMHVLFGIAKGLGHTVSRWIYLVNNVPLVILLQDNLPMNINLIYQKIIRN